MKNTLSTIALLALASIAHAQITLEHTYTPCYAQAVLLSAGTKIYVKDTNVNGFRLYNTDYTTVYKNITPPAITGYTFISANHISDKLFNIDGNIEYMAQYYNSTTHQFKYQILDEAGTVMLDLANSPAITITNFDGDYKLVLWNNTDYSTKFYALPGSLPCNSCGGSTGFPTPHQGKVSSAVPNPSGGSVTITAELPNGINAATLSISDVNGRVMQTIQIYGAQPSVTITTTGYSPGNYVYTLNALGMQPASVCSLLRVSALRSFPPLCILHRIRGRALVVSYQLNLESNT